MLCGTEHKGHKTIHYGDLLPDEKKMNDSLKQLEEKKNQLNNEIDEIIRKLNKVKENLEYYYNIYKNLINNFNKEKINYEILYNINNFNHNDIINDVNNIINTNNFENKFKEIMNIYNKMNITNSISMIYKINKIKDNNIKLFGETFVKNNFNNLKMIIDGKEYKLSEKFKIKNYSSDKIIVKLKGVKNVTNMSYMFESCTKFNIIT